VAVLALTLIVLSVRGDSSSNPTTTTLVAGTSTTTTTSTPSTTTTGATTLATTAEQRLAEVEVLLQDLWFGWFDAIYRKDPDALWEVVATTRLHQDGLAAIDMEGLFIAEPERSGVAMLELEILLDRSDCLVVWSLKNFDTFRGPIGDTDSVNVLWFDQEHGWRFATDWQFKGDLWLQDCDNLERETTP
jgi:hypothetical protein